MTFDLLIRGGTVVDGTGRAARTADVAVRDGVIVGLGNITGAAVRTIDADGALVAPGWVDVHTHYDGQATWDHRLQPSTQHGVTTVVMGNCGVGFAPVRAHDRNRLVELMEGVEDLPGSVLHEGLSWTWESIDEYLDVLGSRQFDADIGAQVCHAPVRLYVMGERGAAGAAANADDIAAMGALASSGIRAGALGFTTSRTINHRTATGDPTPTLNAARDELVGIAAAIGTVGAGVLQVVSDFRNLSDESETLLQMMRVSGRPLSISVAQGAPGRGYRRLLDLLDRAHNEGLQMRGQVAARAIGLIVSIDGSVNPLEVSPTYQAVAGRPTSQRAAALSPLAARSALVTDLVDAYASGRTPLPPLDQLFELDTLEPDYEPPPQASIAGRAARAGCRAEELLVDLLLSQNGAGILYQPALNYFDGDLSAVHEMLAHPRTVAALGDGGAHVGTICDASFPTFLLTHWARDRRRGPQLPLEQVVHMQTQATAAALGLGDRGVLVEGARADINVIDHDRLSLSVPHFAHDLPAGGTRLLQRASGYVHTFVAGIETYANGESTGSLPGRLIRHQRGGPALAAAPSKLPSEAS